MASKKNSPRSRKQSATRSAARSTTPSASAHDFLTRQRIEGIAQGFVTLAGELWVVKDRLAVLEKVLDKHGIPASVVETFEPDGDFKEQLAATRKAYIQRVIASLFPRGMPQAD